MKKLLAVLLIVCSIFPTVCLGSASVGCSAPPIGFIGYTIASASVGNVGTADGVYATYAVTTSGQVTRMGMYFINTDTAKHFTLAIYSSDGLTRIAYTASALVQGNGQFSYANLVAPVYLHTGESYILIGALSDDNDWQARGNGTGTKTIYKDTTWSSADSSINEQTQIDTTAELAIFADGGQTVI